MVYSKKSINVIQEVKILPRVTANHRPGSETRWQEETNVRSRVDRVDRRCIELRNRTYFVAQRVRLLMGPGVIPKRVTRQGRDIVVFLGAFVKEAKCARLASTW